MVHVRTMSVTVMSCILAMAVNTSTAQKIVALPSTVGTASSLSQRQGNPNLLRTVSVMRVISVMDVLLTLLIMKEEIGIGCGEVGDP